MATLKNTKAVAYLRVSGKGQVEGGGFPRQRETIRKFAKASGIEIVAEFTDGGVSGTAEGADRPGLSAMLERIVGNGINLVLVERADRLARDLIVSEMLLAEFAKNGVRVVEAGGGTDLRAGDDPTKKLIRQVLGAVAEFNKSVVVSKLRAARERTRRQKGRCEGRKPYGHFPGEATGLVRIRQLNRKPRGGRRLSAAKIAEILNQERHPTRSGKPWRRASVRAIIKREGLPRD